MEGNYSLSFTHRFQDVENILAWTLNVIETRNEKNPYLMVNWILVDNNGEILLAWQIIRTKEWTNLILGKTHNTSICPRIIYNLKRVWFWDDLTWIYRWKWTNLHWGLVIAINDYRTRAKGLIDSISTHSFIHWASVELKKN